MSESLDRSAEVPELTADEIQARVLHRDGLMLVIDKPAGLPVHRGPKGGANLEASFDALRFGLPRPPVLAHRLDRDTSGCLVLGRHQGNRVAGAVVQARPDFQDLLGGGRRRPDGGRGCDRHAARPPQRRARLVAEARSGRPDGSHQVESAGARFFLPSRLRGRDERSSLSGVGGGGAPRTNCRCGPPSPTLPRKAGGSGLCKWLTSHLARARTSDRPHPSIARSRGLHGLADCRRQYLWQWTALRRAEPASAFPRDRDSDFQEQGAGARSGAGAGAFAATAAGLRMEWGIASLAFFPSPLVGEGGFAKRRRVRGLFLPIGRNPSSGTDFA